MQIIETKTNPYEKFAKDWEEADLDHGFAWNKETFYFESFEGDELAGYFLIVINGGVGELKEIIVKKKFRGRGLGKEVLNYFIKFCTDKKCHKLTILTSENHIAGKALYEKCGFAVENTMENDRYHATWYRYSKII